MSMVTENTHRVPEVQGNAAERPLLIGKMRMDSAQQKKPRTASVAEIRSRF